MFDTHYVNWRISRMNGIRKYLDTDLLKGKSLVELGCGYADIGNEFSKLGCKVSSWDARQEHLNIVNNKYPDIQTQVFDCDKDTIKNKFDFILHWGVLYHIKNIDSHLKNVCENCDYLLLETEVYDTEEEKIVFVNEVGYDQAYNRVGCRPSQKYVENILNKNNFEYFMVQDSIINSGYHVYDWKISNSISYRSGLRRYWICWNKNVKSPLKINS